ncbi:MAG: AbrB family transcriptional regulator [Hyphomicrobiales bacterium]|nr:AbrB family transcriptional regulator [Hyphomicrobiales bacterium]
MQRWFKGVCLLAVAATVGYIFKLIGVPLPWMIGPMLVAGVLSLAGVSFPVPNFFRPTGQTVVATAVGLYFTPVAVTAVAAEASLMLGAAALTIAAGFLTALALVRLARTDGTTAFFAAMPGGPVEMAVLAERWGVSGAPVALSQTLRVVFIVLTIPPVLMLLNGGTPDFVAPLAKDIDPLGLALLYTLTIAGAFLLGKLGVPNGFFLGPLAVAAALTASGVTLSAVPLPLLAAGQVMLGVALGSRFAREHLAREKRFAFAAVVTTGLLLALCFAVALGLWAFSDASLAALTLATAPGSVTEMALTAKLLQHGVAMVTAYHLVRIFIIIPFTPLLFRLFRAVMGRRITFPSLTATEESAGPVLRAR